MNSLFTGLIIAGGSIIFVNVFIFGLLGVPVKTVPLGTLLTIQGVTALFTLFMYLVVRKKA